MTDTTDNSLDTPIEADLDTRKALARELGIKFHPSISLDKLNEKIADAQEALEAGEGIPRTAEEIKAEALKLVRVTISCMNPNKRGLDSELFQVGNGITGTVKKVVPFEKPWHVPQIMLNHIKERQYQSVVTRKVDGVEVKEGKLFPEFAVNVLPPLTDTELKELEQRQAMAAGTADLDAVA